MQAETGSSIMRCLSEVPEIGQVGKQEIEDTIIPGVHWMLKLQYFGHLM